MEKCDEKLKLLQKSSCETEAALNLNQKPVTPCPCVPSRVPLFTEILSIYGSHFLHVSLQGSATLKLGTAKLGTQKKGNERQIDRYKRLDCLACRELSVIFVVLLIGGTIFYPHFLNEESRKRCLRA